MGNFTSKYKSEYDVLFEEENPFIKERNDMRNSVVGMFNATSTFTVDSNDIWVDKKAPSSVKEKKVTIKDRPCKSCKNYKGFNNEKERMPLFDIGDCWIPK
jgi:hypothetical protein